MKKILILVLVPLHFSLSAQENSTKSITSQFPNLNPFKILYGPWRAPFINSLIQNHKNGTPLAQHKCPFCIAMSSNDTKKNYILRKFTHCSVLLNIYPYNSGHLLVVPHAHKELLSDFSSAERSEFMEVTNLCTAILKQALKADGFNVGINLSRGAGASIPDHLHIHVVPRWNGDTNFLLILDGSKPVSVDVETIYNSLKPLFDQAKLTPH